MRRMMSYSLFTLLLTAFLLLTFRTDSEHSSNCNGCFSGSNGCFSGCGGFSADCDGCLSSCDGCLPSQDGCTPSDCEPTPDPPSSGCFGDIYVHSATVTADSQTCPVNCYTRCTAPVTIDATGKGEATLHVYSADHPAVHDQFSIYPNPDGTGQVRVDRFDGTRYVELVAGGMSVEADVDNPECRVTIAAAGATLVPVGTRYVVVVRPHLAEPEAQIAVFEGRVEVTERDGVTGMVLESEQALIVSGGRIAVEPFPLPVPEEDILELLRQGQDIFGVDQTDPEPAPQRQDLPVWERALPFELLVDSLTIWTDDALVPALEELGWQFQERYGIELIVMAVDPGDMLEDVMAALPAGEGPDIFVGRHEWLGSLVTQGLLAELDLGGKVDDYLPTAIQGFRYDGVLYGLPYAVENVALFRNADVLPDAPGSWSQVYELAAELGGGFALWPGDPYHFYPIQTAFGGYLFGLNPDGSYNLDDVGLDSEGSIAAGGWLYDMVGKGLLSVEMDWDIAHRMFESGEAVLIITGPWALEGFRSSGVNYAISTLPAEVQASRPFVNARGFMVSSTSRAPRLAQFFLEESLATEKAMTMLQQTAGHLPAHLEVIGGLEDPDLRAVIKAGSGGLPLPAIPQMDAVWSPWADAINMIFYQELNPEEAFTLAADQVREVVAEGP